MMQDRMSESCGSISQLAKNGLIDGSKGSMKVHVTCKRDCQHHMGDLHL